MNHTYFWGNRYREAWTVVVRGRLVVVDEFLEDGGLTVVDEEELLEMAPPPPAPDWELVVLLGMVPVLEPSILSPVDIGGELALINTD